MKRSNEPGPPIVLVRRHPPERLVRAPARGQSASGCCGCCCCCCCLHSLGGLVGAVVGSGYPPDAPAARGKPMPPPGLRDDELDPPVVVFSDRSDPGTRAVAIFWLVMGVLSLLAIVAPSVISPQDAGTGIWLMLFGLPAVLMAGSVVTAVVIAAIPSLRADRREWKRLGWITAWNVAGTLVGIGVMVLIAVAFSR